MPRRDILQQALSLLEPHARPKLEELVRAIREVNPTARGLSTSEQSKRYELKARLQNVLIRVFGDQLSVVDPEGDIVLLRHLATGKDACHAKVSSLDEDARRWVRWRLDVPPESETSPEPGARTGALQPSAPVDPVERGRVALADYDYDEARACFEQALQACPVDAVAAEALMGLLVDHLARDEDALQLESTLPAPTRRLDSIRILLAVALVRNRGESAESRARAVELVTLSADARAGEILADVAHAAMDAREWEEAARILTRSGRRSERWDGARQRLAKLRADARAPDEEALRSAIGALPEERVETMAHDLITRWPDSRVARQVLAEIATRCSVRAAAQALAEADRCEGADDLKGAALALRAALGRMEDEAQRASIGSRLIAIEARAARLRTEALAHDVLRAIPSLEALRRYAELPAEAASIVRGAGDLPVLALIDELRPGARDSAPSELVSAAIAWAEAAPLASEHEAALEIIIPHAAVVGLSAKGKRFLGELQRGAAAARRARCEQALSKARLALDAMNPEEALREVDTASNSAGAALEGEVRRLRGLAQDLSGDARRFSELEKVTAYPMARAFAQRRADATTDVAIRAGWLARVEKMRLLANVSLRYERSEERLPLNAQNLVAMAAQRRACCWLRECSSEIACVARAGSCVTSVIVDTQKREVIRRCRVDIPAVGSGLSGCAVTDGIWLLYPGGCMKLDDLGEPIDMLSLAAPTPEQKHREVEQIVLSADGNFLWLAYADRVEVVALREGPGLMLTIPEPFRVIPARGADVMVCVHRFTQRIELRASDATAILGVPPPYPWRILSAAAHPNLDGVVLLSKAEIPEPSSSGLSLHTVLFSGKRRETRLRMLPRDRQNRIALATSRRHGRSFLTFERPGRSLLMAVRPEDDCFYTAYYIDLPSKPTLIGDMHGQRVFALGGDADPVLVELTADAPAGFPNRLKDK